MNVAYEIAAYVSTLCLYFCMSDGYTSHETDVTHDISL